MSSCHLSRTETRFAWCATERKGCGLMDTLPHVGSVVDQLEMKLDRTD
jgi:hypothetical protein